MTRRSREKKDTLDKAVNSTPTAHRWVLGVPSLPGIGPSILNFNTWCPCCDRPGRNTLSPRKAISPMMMPAPSPPTPPRLPDLGPAVGRSAVVAAVGPRGHGRRLPGRAVPAEAAGGREDPQARAGRGPHLSEAIRARGPGGRLAGPCQHRADPRSGPQRRAVLHRAGVRRRAEPPPVDRPLWSARSGRAVWIIRQAAAGLGQGGRGGRGTPRHQAGKHHAHAGRRSEGGRFRLGPLGQRNPGNRSDADRHDAGHAPVHEPGAGRGQAAGLPQRPLFLGVTCYHMLAGNPPFVGETALGVAVQHLKGSRRRWRGCGPTCPRPCAASSTRCSSRTRPAAGSRRANCCASSPRAAGILCRGLGRRVGSLGIVRHHAGRPAGLEARPATAGGHETGARRDACAAADVAAAGVGAAGGVCRRRAGPLGVAQPRQGNAAGGSRQRTRADSPPAQRAGRNIIVPVRSAPKKPGKACCNTIPRRIPMELSSKILEQELVASG